MKIEGIVAALIVCGFLSACASKSSNLEWHNISPESIKKITLNLDNTPLKRAEAREIKSVDFWVEYGEWASSDHSNNVNGWVQVYALYEKVFTSASLKKIESLIRSFTGDGYLVFGEKESIKTVSGTVNIQYYTVSGLACIFVENYWRNPTTFSQDRVRHTAQSSSIIGNYRLQANYCLSDRDSLNSEDASKFLNGIQVKDIYWPTDRFFSANKL